MVSYHVSGYVDDERRNIPRHYKNNLIFLFVPYGCERLKTAPGMSCLGEAALDSMISSGTPYGPMETGVVYRIDMNVIDPEVYSTLRQAMQRNYPRHLFLPNADSLVFRSQPTDYSAQDKDDRPDTDVKKEIYEKYIKDKYNVVYAIDDRTRLVDQRRELGIFTFDVNQTREVF